MKKRMILTIAIVAMLVLIAACQSYAVGKYCLAFWRETGYYEKGGTGGMHVLNVHVWDESGNPCVNKQIITDAGLSMGYTDSKGQLEIALYEPNSYPVKVNDGSNLTDVTPAFSTTRAPDWGHYCFEAGFLYKSDSTTAGSFDTNYDGVFNSTAGQPCELSAPKMRSIAFYGTKPDMGYYCSDNKEIGGSVASLGQTFVATGNRVIACKVQVLGGFPMKYEARIREGGPSGTVLGSVAISPDTGTYEYLKTLTKWGTSGVTVTPGNTYFLEIKKNGGGNIQAYRVVNNNYSGGCYYEGTTAFTGKELMGHVVCMSTTSSTGAIAGTVKDSGNNAISGATVSTTTGGYTTTTNASGAYTISNVSAGTYSVVAQKTGYNASTLTGQSVTAGATTTCNFTLTTASTYGTIAGNVKDGAGVNVSGATVSTTVGGYTTTTNSSGNYTLSNVATGTYNVVASKSGYNSQTQSNKTVNTNQTTTVNFTITSQSVPFSGISNKTFEGGFFNDPDVDHQSGNSWHRFAVSGSSKAGGIYGTYHSANWSQGIYESSWVAGIYQQGANATVGNEYTASVWVRGSDSNVKFWVGIDPTGGTDGTSANVQWSAESIPGATWTQISKQATATASTITMFIKAQNIAAINKYAYIDDADLVDNGPGTPPTSGSIAGNVKDGAGANVAGATVSTTTGGYTTTTDASGNYTLTSIPAGTYSVVASKSGYNSQTQTGKTVTAGQTTTCNFTITRQTGTLSGNVKNDSAQNLSGATVSTTTGGYTTTTDASGNYTLANVATGTYDVVASKTGYQSQTQTGKTVNNAATTTVNFTLAVQTNPFSSILNKNFEGGSYNSPDADHKVANSWTKFLISGAPKHGVPWLTTWHSGNYGQEIYEASWTMGLYQQATYATVGRNYTASVWVKGADSNLKFWVGIDPTGGTNAASANVQWSAESTPGATWTQITKQVAASSSTITIFVKAQNISALNKYGYIDDADLVEN